VNETLKRAAKFAGRQTIGRLPRSAARLAGPLAIHGGTPVRNLRYRPWPAQTIATRRDWVTEVGPAFRAVFLGGAEGLPQTRQKEFAARWAEYCGCKFGLLLPHGTDALRLALAAAFDHDGLDYGGEVIVPNLSFIASATAALDRRFGVAFVDVDPDTLNIDPRQVEAAIVPGRTRAIMPVHQFGQPADMTTLSAIAHRHGLKIIEDAAQAHGARWESGPVGSLGDAAAFSFQSAKNLAAGEGGMLTTSDADLFERAYALHNAGRSRPLESRWEHPFLGWNVRPTEYTAALLSHRFRRFPEEQQRRAAAFARLRQLITDTDCVRPLATHPGVRAHGMYMFVMRYQAARCGGAEIEQFLDAVRAEGVPLTRCYSSTLSAQPSMASLMARRPDYVRALPTPVSDVASGEIVYLPSNVFLADPSQMDDIVGAIGKVQRALAASPR
jgi:dTDP-4-amino-4,6-dideoxygalactose transaminase